MCESFWEAKNKDTGGAGIDARAFYLNFFTGRMPANSFLKHTGKKLVIKQDV